VITRRGLAAWAGSDRIPIVRARLGSLAALPVTRASAELALFVAGVEVERALLGAVDEELVEVVGDRARARVSVLPIGDALIVCDRADATEHPELVCWPDDSSFHLASAIPPGRHGTWLDLGCGSAVAPLSRPALADRIVVSDLNPRAVRFAELGAKLSNVRLETLVGDLAVSPADLITCNAPIPGDHVSGSVSASAMWRATDESFVVRLFEAARSALSPDGLIVVHSALDAIPSVLPGESVIVVYTPPDVPRQFAITWWSPSPAGTTTRQIRARRLLDPSRPHLDHRDREAALAGNLPAL
jgi:methylase of polypeptide subunit release factors